jgi:branched-chain amino acid transport system permease protein
MTAAPTAAIPDAAPSPAVAAFGMLIRLVWPLLLAVVIGYLLQTQITGFPASLVVDCGIAIILAVSLTVVNGFAGQFSIGHEGFMAVGGYIAAALVYYCSYKFFHDTDNATFHGGLLSSTPRDAAAAADISLGHWREWFGYGDLLFVVACLIGAIISTAVGWLVGLPSLRLRGDYLAIVTLGFGEIVRVLIQGTPQQLDSTTDPSVTDVSLWHELGINIARGADGKWALELPHFGGALGFSGAPAYTTLFWVGTATILTLVLTIRLKNSSYGRALLSIREDEIAAQAMGINTTRYKVRAFMYGAFFAGLGGALYAMKVGSINAGELGFQKSFDIIIMVVLGGLGSVSGATLAAILLTLLPEALRDPTRMSIYPWGIAAGIAILALVQLARLAGHHKRPPLRAALTIFAILAGWQLLRYFHMTGRIRLSDYRMILYSLALIVMMIARPSGFFGVHELWDYLPASWQFWQPRAARTSV